MQQIVMRQSKIDGCAGFTLIELSIVLIILSLIASALLTLGTKQGEGARVDLTNQRLDMIEKALGTFVLANGRLPCPAEGQIAPGAAGYGVEDASVSCTNTNIVAANLHAGSVPVVTLGLNDEVMLDAWNRRFTYVVDEFFVVANDFRSADMDAGSINEGRITVYTRDDDTTTPPTRTTTAGLVLISHGSNAHGAWPKTQTGVDRINSTAGNASEEENSHTVYVGPATALNFDAQFTQENRSTTFDDIVRFYERWQVIALAGGVLDQTSCEMVYLSTLASNPLTTPEEGAIGCINDVDLSTDGECELRQRTLSERLRTLCFLQ